MIKYYRIFYIVSLLLINTNAQSQTIDVDCPAGRVSGSRIDNHNGINIGTDGVSQPKLDYHIDTDDEKKTNVTYGGKTTPAWLIKNKKSGMTLVYIFNGVPYMDTIFLDGLVYSTEHKDFPVNVALTWHYKCSINK